MSSKNTKRALLTSVLALVLCMSMLVGTTFAWFTDSVTSGKNVITAGNLDVELEYLGADGQWAKVGEDTNLFEENALWEPGHTEVVYLKVVNAGSLAFNYKMGVNIVEEVSSTNVAGETFKLSDYIMMGAVSDFDVAYPTRQDARDAVDEDAVKAIAKGYAQEGVLYPVNNLPTDIDGASSDEYVALVVYMPETVGNEANHKTGVAAPKITLGISLYATQKTYEEDSFDDQYDAGANVAVPPVPVEPESLELTVYNLFGAQKDQQTVTVTMDVYEFNATNFSSVYPVETYKNWICDYFVSTDKPLKEGTFLAGNYGTFGWLGFWVPGSETAYEPIPLLGTATNGGVSNWTYQEICEGVQLFRCGIYDYDGLNAGVKATVELRMTNPENSEDYITVTSTEVIL